MEDRLAKSGSAFGELPKHDMALHLAFVSIFRFVIRFPIGTIRRTINWRGIANARA